MTPIPMALMVSPVELSLIGFVVLAAVATALARDVLTAIIVFSAYSFGMAALYTFYRAPDVAMTEAAVSAGVTTLLLLLTIAKTSRIDYDVGFQSVDWPAAGVTGLLAGLMLYTVPSIPAVGDKTAPIWSNPDVTQYYIANTYADTGVENAVTAVLASYRGFDTFGEAVVVFAAGVAGLLVLQREVFS
ncbi:MAG: multisubunit sodium/proton antiporter, MrpB subunit [uncultured archaeon A07HR60]|jgi:Predicted subunit of the Multisubunit Na+/H+ antiporter|nr:MAG: multisubunit sodium/proton antiporter, MrpB subunit [uncultured archaeon A07HR60]